MDVPGAFVWAVLAFVTNFIPNIGFIIGVIPPALIALLDGGPGLMVAVIVVYSVINFVIQSVIQPRVVGDAVGLSPTLTFLSLVFWTWVIGPLGALLAVPLSLLTRALLVEADPRGRVGAAADLRQAGGRAATRTGAADARPRSSPGEHRDEHRDGPERRGNPPGDVGRARRPDRHRTRARGAGRGRTGPSSGLAAARGRLAVAGGRAGS